VAEQGLVYCYSGPITWSTYFPIEPPVLSHAVQMGGPLLHIQHPPVFGDSANCLVRSLNTGEGATAGSRKYSAAIWLDLGLGLRELCRVNL
jgi:hypothetical protein